MISALTRCVDRGRVSKCEVGSQETVQNDKEARCDVSPKNCQLMDITLPSWLRVVTIMQSRIQFFYSEDCFGVFRGGTRLAMLKTICAPNISSLKTGSGATEGVLD